MLRRRRPAPVPEPHAIHLDFSEGPVLVVGDSHTWMAGAGRQYPGWDTDCKAGRTTAEALGVVEAHLAPRHGVVVFDMATNDDEVPAAEHWTHLEALRRLIGRRQLVFVSSWRLDKSLEHVVANQRRMAAEDPLFVSVADWADYVAHHPGLFADDHVHFRDEALPIRNGIVWTAVRAAQLRIPPESA